ncbi:hypothetical protein N0V83_006839 [Neocucurbitaria cava]|uniref:Xylanolytic transcriptional activator regulatory domain-containing protein n=1 Tax=Neocucurbitaria cava TaxID=798079 RepID=A0A9W9CJQ5_9PLEO|nr:hypothetical protein N0V83_006839 [Neocucurbitaria cava]
MFSKEDWLRSWKVSAWDEIACSAATRLDPVPTPQSSTPSQHVSHLDQYTGVARELVAVWPSKDDLRLIFDLPVRLSTHLHMRPCTSPAAVISEELPSAQSMLQLPPPNSHPVLFARKLLILGSLLQGALSSSHIPETQRQHYEGIMSDAVGTAVRLVTTNDDLITYVEGIECIMMEAMIHNYASRLHQTWRTLRRATTVAQILGLHRNSELPSTRFLDPKTRTDFDAENICFHLVSMDRYTSMVLGLPHSSGLPYASTMVQLAAFQPLERMARLQCNIAARILSRDTEDHTSMHDIDVLLLHAAAEMPHQWWLVPDLDYLRSHEPDPTKTIARFNYQFSHYHLLLRLHLPYLLRSSSHTDHTPSKITALTASREILARFIAFRTWNSGQSYCRGMDFLAFVATIVLCVAHIDSQSIPETPAQCTNIGLILAHSRSSDRAVMERSLEILQVMIGDELALKLCKVMQYLLDIEADAANGIDYRAATTSIDDSAIGEYGGLVDEGSTLQLHIPSFGIISLQQRSAMEASTDRTAVADPFNINNGLGTPLDEEWSQLLSAPEDWTFQSVNSALFGSLCNSSNN